MNTSVHKFLFATLLILTVALSGCGPSGSPKPALTPATVQLHWAHNAQSAGLYATDQKGYYAAEGLAVTFLQGGTGVDYLSPVLKGSAQFGVATADKLVLARAEGKSLRAIATVYRRSPIVFFALANSGITRPQDFVGKKIRVGSVSLVPTLHAMTTHVGVRPDQYTEVVLPSDPTLFASGEVPVCGGYLTAFMVEIERAGYKLNIIYPDDYGVHFYGDSIIARDDWIVANPDVVRRFLRATLKGWTYAVENPATVGPMVVKYNPKADPALENTKITASLPLINTGEDHIGCPPRR